MEYSTRTGRGLARSTAALTGAAATTHLVTAVGAAAGGNVTLAMALLGLAVACAPCATGLWRAPDAAGWRMTAAMAAGMLALHGPLMRFSGPMAHPHASAGYPDLSIALSAVQLAIAAAVVVDHHTLQLGRSRGQQRPRRTPLPQ